MSINVKIERSTGLIEYYAADQLLVVPARSEEQWAEYLKTVPEELTVEPDAWCAVELVIGNRRTQTILGIADNLHIKD